MALLRRLALGCLVACAASNGCAELIVGEASSLVQLAAATAARSSGTAELEVAAAETAALGSQGKASDTAEEAAAAPHRSAPNASEAAETGAPDFDEHTAALSRMFYGFYMLSSCPELMTPLQVKGSRCKHCEAAGFDFSPGELRIVHLRERPQADDTAAVVARLRPRTPRRPGGPHRAGGCMLAIRGTQTMGNVFADVRIAREPMPECPGCSVHRGWLRQWRLLRPHVLEKMAELGCDGPEQALYITGHSSGPRGSGCAVSDYAALDLHRTQGHPVAASIGYDCPRPGDASFARAFDAAFPGGVWKVQVDFDPVRHLPPRWTGYQDVGWAAQYLHGAREGFLVCGRGGALCPGDRAPRLGDDLAKEIKSFHCAAPHSDTWSNKIYMRCDAKCDATLLEPEWGMLPEAAGAAALLQPGPPEMEAAGGRAGSGRQPRRGLWQRLFSGRRKSS